MRTLLRLTLFVVVTLALSASAVEGGNKRESLFRQLKALPDSAAPFGRVKHLVLRLVAIDPQRAYKYYRIGIRRISFDADFWADIQNLEKKAVKIIRRSDLADVRLAKAEARLRSEYIEVADSAYIPDSPPTPTPTPTPSPIP